MRLQAAYVSGGTPPSRHWGKGVDRRSTNLWHRSPKKVGAAFEAEIPDANPMIVSLVGAIWRFEPRGD